MKFGEVFVQSFGDGFIRDHALQAIVMEWANSLKPFILIRMPINSKYIPIRT